MDMTGSANLNPMPDFRPFPALRYAHDLDEALVLAPPYDVLSREDVDELHTRHPDNITHIDVPEDQDYDRAAELLWSWVEDGVLISDNDDTFTVYRMSFTDASGHPREIVGVMGGLEVVDEGSTPGPGRSDQREFGHHAGIVDETGTSIPGRTTVLPHERVTAKASTDRLELMRATAANTSPIWGLSLAPGLTEALRAPGLPVGSVTVDGVTHAVEKVADPARIAEIREILASDDVLIADGHHRYGVSRVYRNEVRSASGRRDTRAEHTLAFVSELVEDQLVLDAIHRLYSGITPEALREALAAYFDFSPVPEVTPGILDEMVQRSRLVLLWPDHSAEWLTPKPGAFDTIRCLDGVWLETALSDTGADVSYQHGLDETLSCLATRDYTAGVLIRPTSIEEIRRTAREGLLMPPKSTFFTPKLLTGWVIRPTEPLSGQ